MPSFSDHAVRTLASFVSTNLAAALAQVENDEGLVAGALLSASKISRAFNPESFGGGDGRPEVQVYETTETPINQRNDMLSVQCSVDVLYTWNSADDLEAAEDFGRRWKTAIRRMLDGRHPQAANSGAVFIVGDGGRLTLPYNSTTRYGYSTEVEVRVHSPRS